MAFSFIFQSGRIGADEEIDDLKGRSADEIEEVQAEKEAKTRAILLEMVNIFLYLPLDAIALCVHVVLSLGGCVVFVLKLLIW